MSDCFYYIKLNFKFLSSINILCVLGGNHLEKARNSLNEALDVIAKKEQKKSELETENDILNL